MRPREIKWLIAIVFIGVLSGIMIKSAILAAQSFPVQRRDAAN